ncbi:MAG TPA: rhomboid family intramembrane serine protease [Tepidisphaeraceae bacterium]|jgi:membrane associated rhomboid family serine protease|nr:rhomboid family intramembrane serine protease [Tepidisphaeraceae bacterium]
MGWQDRTYNTGGGDTIGPRLSDYKPRGLALVMILTVLGIFILQIFGIGPFLREWGSLRFDGGRGWWQPWRFITYQYIHGDGSHIFWNMLSMYFILPLMERTYGWRRTLGFYTLGGVAAGLTYAVMSYVWGHSILIGASGSILAVLGAVAALMPGIMFFGIIPVRILALLYAVLYVLTILHDRNMSNVAHLGGLAFGFIVPLIGQRFDWNLTERFTDYRRERSRRMEQDEQQAIDRILQKVHEHGMNSLSRSDRNTLKRATERQRVSDARRRVR